MMMPHEEHPNSPAKGDEVRRTPFLRTPSGMALCVFLAVAGVLLWMEHRAHILEYLPVLLLLVCIGMHLFMHRGHGGLSHQPPARSRFAWVL
jgi:hypothetical protein